MKTIFILFALIVLTTAYPGYLPRFDKSLNTLWEEYKKSFNKAYETEELEIFRRLVWEKNVDRINRHNLESDLGNYKYWLGINEYSDMMEHEFKKTMNGFRRGDQYKHNASLVFVDEDVSDLPEEVNWRKEGFVTEVKNQGNCGSCWAFSATGSLEGQLYKNTGNLVSLSEQDLVDCAGSCGTAGCEGGLMDAAFKCIHEEGGIDSEASYPYEGRDDACRFNSKTAVTTLSGYVDVKRLSEKALQKAVAIVGPISVAIDASDYAFNQYKDGIYESNSCSSLDLDHGVLVVGYGTEDGQDYWLVKNSWGKSWGMDGYIKMARNKNNMCGIATLASYPVL